MTKESNAVTDTKIIKEAIYRAYGVSPEEIAALESERGFGEAHRGARLHQAAQRVVHHYYCTLPTVGVGRCPICSKIRDPETRGTMTVLIDDLERALE